MANISQFNRESQQRIADVVRRVEQSPPAPSQRGHRITPHAKEVRWGITATTYEHPTYPASGPVYGVKLGELVPSPDPPYPGATITKTLVPYDPAVEIVATDPDDGDWGEGSIVRVERHDGRWWIRPSPPASSSTVAPLSLYGTSYYLTGGGSYPRGGSYGNSEYYTIGYPYFSGSEADNHVTIGSVGSATDWTFQVDQTGYYLLSVYCSYTLYYSGTNTATYTTSTNSAHNHTVATFNGAGIVATVQSWFWYRATTSGTYDNLLTRGTVLGYGIAQNGPPYATTDPPGSMCKTIGVNLTAGWQVQQRLRLATDYSTTDHAVGTPGATLVIQYLGSTQTETSP